jgi:hypothetical protein
MRAALAAALLLPAARLVGQDAPLVVHLADGTTLPMTAWALSYEYAAWGPGGSPALARSERREARTLWLGKREQPLAGSTLEFEYDVLDREVEQVEGGSVTRRVPVLRGLTLSGAGGGPKRLKPEPPHRDFLAAGDKSRLVQARSLELVGQTLTGTRRSFCLISYSALVQCQERAGQQVVKLEFPK